MNQVEQWFGILQRKRLRIADFADKKVLAERLQAFIAEWNAYAHPFNWTSNSVAKVMAKCQVDPPHPVAHPANSQNSVKAEPLSGQTLVTDKSVGDRLPVVVTHQSVCDRLSVREG